MYKYPEEQTLYLRRMVHELLLLSKFSLLYRLELNKSILVSFFRLFEKKHIENLEEGEEDY